MTDAIIPGRELQEVFDELAEVSMYLWEKGWAERNAGNISWNVTHLATPAEDALHGCPYVELPRAYPNAGSCSFLVTVTGSRMRDLRKFLERDTCIIWVPPDGRGYHIVWGARGHPRGRPTSELPTHLAIHGRQLASRGRDRTVVHTHPTELIALTHIPEYCDEQKLNQLLWSVHPESILVNPDGVGFVPYALTGTEDLAEATAAALDNHPIVIWEKHGCVARGKDAADAFDYIDIAAKAARLFFMCKSAGYAPAGLTAAQLQELRRTLTGKS